MDGYWDIISTIFIEAITAKAPISPNFPTVQRQIVKSIVSSGSPTISGNISYRDMEDLLILTHGVNPRQRERKEKLASVMIAFSGNENTRKNKDWAKLTLSYQCRS